MTTNVIEFGRIYKEDLAQGNGPETVILADGQPMVMHPLLTASGFINDAYVSLAGLIVDVAGFATNGAGTTGDPWRGWETACTAGGKIYFFRPGYFSVDQLPLVSNTWYIGAGHGSIIRSITAANDYALACIGTGYFDNITISNLTIDGNKANNTSGGGIYLHGRNTAVLNCYVHDCANVGILYGVPSNGAMDTPLDSGHRIIGNYVKDCSVAGGGWGGIAITHGRNMVIANNIVESTDASQTFGINVEPNTANLISGIVITGNEIRGGRIFIDGLNITGASGIEVTNNLVDASTAFTTSSTNNAGIFVRHAGRISVRGNTVIGNPGYFQQGFTAMATITDLAVESNTFFVSPYVAGTEYGMWFDNAAAVVTRGTIGNNSIIASAAFDYGIYSFHATGLASMDIRNNHCVNVTTPYAIGSAGLGINGGTAATIADGGTIAHGLGVVPTKVSVAGSVSGEFVSVTGLSTSAITVAIKKYDNSGGTTQTIYWSAEV